jgi:PD-(D/E)XK nuclease family transposase
MPKFNKSEDELETDFDKWMFVFKNLHLLDKMPSRLQNKIFTKLFGEAELANLQATDRAAYEESLKIYRDLKNVTDTAYDQGFKEASDILNEKIAKEQLLKEEEQRQKETIIFAFYQSGKSAEDIATLLGIPVDSILSIIHKKGDF